MRSKILKLSAFAAVSVLLTIYIGLKIVGASPGTSYHHFSAVFGDVSGLHAGDPVNLAGVPVGRVSHVKLVDGRAEVGLAVKSSVTLPSDTQVAVRWRNLIGQRTISLVPGASGAPLASGARISRTASVVDLSDLVNNLGPLAAQINPQQLNDIFTALARALNGNQGNVASLVSDLTGVVSTLAQRNQTIGQLLTDYQKITGALASRDQQIQIMVENLALLSQAFADNSQLAGNALDQLSGLSTGLDHLLVTSGTQLGRVIDNLSVLTGVLHGRIDDLENALHNLPPALQALFAATRTGQYLSVFGACVSITPTCPVPIVPAPQAASASASSSLPLDSPGAFQRLLVGGS